jgi:hypothetical protein
MSVSYSCGGSYEYERQAKSTREIRKEMQEGIVRNFNNGKYYFFQSSYEKCQTYFDYVIEDKKYDTHFYSDSVYNFYKQNLNFAIENKGIWFAEEIAKKYYLFDYIKLIDSIKTTKQDSVYRAMKEKEKKDRKWVFYKSGYYEMSSDPEHQYAGIDYIYLWYDENSIMRDGNFIYVMTKFSYSSSGNCPTYQYFRFDINTGDRTTIDLYHSCLEIYTGVHNWEMGKIEQEFFDLIKSKLE